ncbi:hypothetical protein [Xanthomonas sp. NCPPB 2632]|uniref:hypothetical protein n=1 Tax=Xanthomonas sp. NCPPB 2632 TaxID=3240912 RepID=UPI003510FA85
MLPFLLLSLKLQLPYGGHLSLSLFLVGQFKPRELAESGPSDLCPDFQHCALCHHRLPL